MPVKVLDADGIGQDCDIIEGVVWAADHGADVILMSFSNPGYSESLQAAVDYAWAKGAVLVAATGNDGSTAATFPAGDRGVIGVSTTGDDALARRPTTAPPSSSARPASTSSTSPAAATTITGTSASAANVAGAAALLRATSIGASNGVIVGAPGPQRRRRRHR